MTVGAWLSALVLLPAPWVQPAQVDLPVDAAITGGTAVAWLTLRLLQDDLARTDCPCERGDVNELDRVAVDESLSTGEVAADITVGVTLAAPLILVALTAPDEHAYLDDLTLVLQSAAIAGLLTQIVKPAASRPYPYMYRPAEHAEQNGDGANYASFWSGHTAVPMAAAVTYAWTLHARRPNSGWRWVAWVAGPALAVSAGALQISASNHFPSDVAAGALVGAGVGLTNPWLHTVF